MGRKKNKIKSSENDQLTGHFQSFFFLFCFFFSFFFVFFTISRKTVKQQSVLNIYICHHFPKNQDRIITLNSVTLKNTQTEPQKYILFFQPNK